MFQFVCVVASTVIVYHTSTSIANKDGLPWLNQASSWTILGTYNIDNGLGGNI